MCSWESVKFTLNQQKKLGKFYPKFSKKTRIYREDSAEIFDIPRFYPQNRDLGNLPKILSTDSDGFNLKFFLALNPQPY